VSLTKPAIKRDSPDYYSGLVANAALGNGFASRLNREIRIKRGLSYGARSSLDVRRDAGAFIASAQTKNESAAEVASLLQTELKRLETDPVQGDELKSRQALLTGNYARSLETDLGFASQIAGLAVYNLPLETLDKFISAINAVTTKDVTAFAKKYLAPPPSLVIVGKASAFVNPLKKNFSQTKVIPQANLDLNRADLEKQKNSSSRVYQIRTRFSGATNFLSLACTLNASYQLSIFRAGPITRNWRGECGSLTACLRTKSSETLPRHAWAQPRKTRCSPLNPSSTGAGFPASDRR